MKYSITAFISGLLLSLLAAGCRDDSASSSTPPVAATQSANESPFAGFFTQAEPAGEEPLLKAVNAGQFDREVVVTGKVGEIISGRGAFQLVDQSIKDCNQPGESCPTPWDMCCEPAESLRPATVMVELRDAKGQLIAGDIINQRGLYHLSTLVVTGTLTRDKDGNQFLTAKSIYVKIPSPLDVAKTEASKKKK